MEIKLLFFGQVADITENSALKIPHQKNTNELKNWLVDKWPLLKTINFSIAVNKTMIQENTDLKQDDTVALLPPFSGG